MISQAKLCFAALSEARGAVVLSCCANTTRFEYFTPLSIPDAEIHTHTLHLFITGKKKAAPVHHQEKSRSLYFFQKNEGGLNKG